MPVTLLQLKCFLAVAETLHFGHAASRAGMLPASLGRHIRLLEQELGTVLLARTTRTVALTESGEALVPEAQALIDSASRLESRFRDRARRKNRLLRVGAIDSVAAGLLPGLLRDFRTEHPGIGVDLLEDKGIRLLPKLLSGRLDIIFIRPPETPDPALALQPLFCETAMVAVPDSHPLAARRTITIPDMAEQPLIVPDRRSRPHSHDLTIRLFLEAGLTARVAQIADEKQTIVNLVASGIGLAIVPRWASRLAVPGVRFLPLELPSAAPETTLHNRLALAAAWLRGVRDPSRDQLLDTLDRHLPEYAATA